MPDEIVDAAERCTGDDEFFQQIGSWLDDGGDVNDATNERASLLGRSNHPHLTKFLLERGADVNCVNESGMTPLYYSCGIPNRGGTDIINMLLDAGAPIDATETWGQTPIYNAIQHDNPETVSLLVAQGASLTVRDQNGRTPVDYARTNYWPRGIPITKFLGNWLLRVWRMRIGARTYIYWEGLPHVHC